MYTIKIKNSKVVIYDGFNNTVNTDCFSDCLTEKLDCNLLYTGEAKFLKKNTYSILTVKDDAIIIYNHLFQALVSKEVYNFLTLFNSKSSQNLRVLTTVLYSLGFLINE